MPVTDRRDASASLFGGLRRDAALVDKQALGFQDTIGGFEGHKKAGSEAQERPELALAEGRMPGNQRPDAFGQSGVERAPPALFP